MAARALYTDQMRPETLAVHAGRSIDPATGAVTPPIHLSTTFERALDGSFPSGFAYTREANPNRSSFEACVNALEGGEVTVAYSSGSAATMSILQGLTPGDHVIAPEEIYFGTRHLMETGFGRWGLQSSFVDMTDLGAVLAAIRPNTRLIWVETPSNPVLKIVDIAALAEMAHAAGAICVCDNTWAPLIQRPFELGVDLSMHSATKYLGGHCDIMIGVVIARKNDAFAESLRLWQKMGGAIPSPFECWLGLRGMQTLPWRMRAHCENASVVARALAGYPGVEQVHYPGLASHPGHAIAKKQMSAFGGMLSIQVRGDAGDAMAMTNRLQLITRATSLGGAHTLIEHRKSIEGAASKTPENLLRISVGLEHPDDIIEDLMQALR